MFTPPTICCSIVVHTHRHKKGPKHYFQATLYSAWYQNDYCNSHNIQKTNTQTMAKNETNSTNSKTTQDSLSILQRRMFLRGQTYTLHMCKMQPRH